MNKRLTELAEQAGFRYIKDEGIGWAGNHNASLPKFAELIIQECITACATNRLGKTAGAEELVKQHFGVEE